MTNSSKRGKKRVHTNVVHVVMIFHMLQYCISIFRFLEKIFKILNIFLQTTKHILLHYYFLASINLCLESEIQSLMSINNLPFMV